MHTCRLACSPSYTIHKVCGERERLRKLKAAHAGVNAKAWNTAHASLDRELVKFQKFLKSKARRAAEEEVLQVNSFKGFPQKPIGLCKYTEDLIKFQNCYSGASYIV